MLVAGDAGLLCLALFLAALLRFGEPVNIFREYSGATPLYVLSFLVGFYLLDLYSVVEAADTYRTLKRLLGAGVFALLVTSTVFYFLFPYPREYRYGRGLLVLATLLSVALAYAWRIGYLHASKALFRPIPTLVVGTHAVADAIRRLLESHPMVHQFAGFVASAQDTSESASGVVGAIADLPRLVEKHRAGCVVLAAETPSLTPAQAEDLTRLKFSGVAVLDAPQFYMRVAEALPIDFLNESWLLFAEGFELLQAKVARRIKRIADIALALIALLLALPLTLLIAVIIKVNSRGPVFFGQPRVGWLERPFRQLRFRCTPAGAPPESAPTWAGRWLRRLHLEDVPQIVNVLKGEMSFVGPRPEHPQVVEQLKAALPFYHLRYYVPPGITGWAQITEPSQEPRERAREKLERDLYYIMNASIWLDLRILLQTTAAALQGRMRYHRTQAKPAQPDRR